VSARADADPNDPMALTTYHDFRARQEVTERREVARLVQREREVEVKRTQHSARVRDELALDQFLESKRAAAVRDEQKRDQARMDELGRRTGSPP